MSITQVQEHAATALAKGTNLTHRAALVTSYRFPFLHSNFIQIKSDQKETKLTSRTVTKKSLNKSEYARKKSVLLDIKCRDMSGWGGGGYDSKHEVCFLVICESTDFFLKKGGRTVHSLLWTAFSASLLNWINMVWKPKGGTNISRSVVIIIIIKIIVIIIIIIIIMPRRFWVLLNIHKSL